ncbi:AprI/Inh family metalloprotease inhibitor [Tepidamorphus sp. 3E244]|uniref:AprI/Inh family metalloprotease inhibitor n=1 Tax=Tepidamorphus sp. 3E244 TaxID=3385498 RepID=UPI0038FC1783
MYSRFIAISLAALTLAACSNGMQRRAPFSTGPAPNRTVTSEQLTPPPDSQTARVDNRTQQDLYQQQLAQQQAAQQQQQQGMYPQGYPQNSDPQAQQQPQTQQQTQVAAANSGPQPSSVATTVAAPKKEDVLGQWTIADSFSSCQLNVSLTGWSGGYRASTRNCTSEELKKIGAWNIEGNSVVLKDQSGAQVAVLSRKSERRFDGSLSAGGAVALLR